MAKLRREIDQLNMNFESQAAALKKKGSDAATELLEQIEQLTRMKNKTEKERSTFQKQLDESNYALDDEAKQRVDFERRAKTMDSQLVELRLKSDEQVGNKAFYVPNKGSRSRHFWLIFWNKA